MREHFLIVGGGQAAVQAIQTARQNGFDGAITLLGEESCSPYQRPPLSKKYLAGELPRERLALRPHAFYADREVALELGCRVAELDLAARRVTLGDGRVLGYDKLLLATGSRVRKLDVPGADLAGTHYLRTIDDADAITRSLLSAARVVLVGAGYIGLEVAAVLVERGHDVTVLEAADRVMARVVCREVSDFYHAYHTKAGVKIRYGASVSRLAGKHRVEAVEVATGEIVPCDIVIVGIGVEPSVELARSSGLPCDNGIVVDAYACTADPRVYAAGDCTSHPYPGIQRRIRLESVQNAIHQAKVAAANLTGTPTAYSEVPWFWSDQYDLKLQIAGLSDGYDDVVIRGDRSTKSFAAYYLSSGRVVAVDAVNSPRDFLHAKRLVASRAQVSATALADLDTDVAALAK
jgi:3-phenylpropionate/trans-cinnamate dioxygenase ferredoxin reductase subunit